MARKLCGHDVTPVPACPCAAGQQLAAACHHGRSQPDGTPSLQHAAMTTIDEMLHLDLLTPHQHELIAAWIARVKTPDAILQMPAHLWQALEQASERMNVDADLRQLPPFAA